MDFAGQKRAEQLCFYMIVTAGILAFALGWFDASYALMMKVSRPGAASAVRILTPIRLLQGLVPSFRYTSCLLAFQLSLFRLSRWLPCRPDVSITPPRGLCGRQSERLKVLSWYLQQGLERNVSFLGHRVNNVPLSCI